jgi:hypothetical protein
MRVLHEDVISRIALLQEGIDRSNGNRRRSEPRSRRPKRRPNPCSAVQPTSSVRRQTRTARRAPRPDG